MTCRHLTTLRELRAQLNALDLEDEDSCGAVVIDPEPKPGKPEIRKPFFGGKFAPWAIPAHMIANHPLNARYLAEFLKMSDGGINLNSHRWAILKRYFDDKTPLVSGLQIRKPGWCNLNNSARIPWHPSWQHADDGDSFVIMVNKETGLCYLVWQIEYDERRNIIRCGTANVVMAGNKPRGGPVANIWIKSNGYEPSRASGIALPHMLVTREEIDGGLIPHCLALGLPRPSKAMRFAPATKNIGPTGSNGIGRLGTGVRIAYDRLLEADLTQWVNTFPSELQRHMRTIGRAVIDYGFMLVDNADNGSVYFENNISANWDELGLTSDVMLRSLYSLLKPNVKKARILAEPTFPGGDMNKTARYEGIDYPAEL